MKHYTHKLTALLLAALFMVSPVAQYACAEEAAYYTETKYPLLADVRDQLDEDEIVAAYDVIINMGDYFNPSDVSVFKAEKTNLPTDKVEVSFFSAHATDGAAFTSAMPGSYFIMTMMISTRMTSTMTARMISSTNPMKKMNP